MRLTDYLRPDLVLADLKAVDKAAVLDEMVTPLVATGDIRDPARTRQILLEREQLGTTGIGDGVAIPHGKIEGISTIRLVVGRSRSGIPYDALDGRPCTIFFLVLAPEQAAGMHLRILASISRLLKDDGFRRSFMSADDGDALYSFLNRNI